MELSGKVGAPLFAAAFVAFLTSSKMRLGFLPLMGIGLGLIWLSHWGSFHRER